eukprot:509769_1
MAKVWDMIKNFITMVLIVMMAWKYRNKLKKGACDVNDTQCADEYFTSSYQEARLKFLKYSANIAAANTYNIPIYTQGDETLYTDITILNENSKSNRLIIHLSGVHGVEGFTGSGIQLALLHHISNPIQNNKFGNLIFDTDNDNEKPIIIFVHAVNPFGFAKFRRNNEQNIDLNRNFKTPQQWNDFKLNGPNKFHYNDLNAVFNPHFRLEEASSLLSKIPKNFRQYFINMYHNINYCLCWLRLPYFALQYGVKQMKAAATIGQMHNQKGLQYVGNGKLAASHNKLQKFFEDKFDEHMHWKKQFNFITLIDVHSGDSSYGIDKLLTEKYENAMKLKRLFLDYDDKDLIQSLNSDDNDGDVQFLDGIYDNVNGYTFRYGDVIGGLMDESVSVDMLVFASEFGSNHMLETVGVCQTMENAYFQEYKEYIKHYNEYGEGHEVMKEFLERSQRWLKDVFYVQEPEW